ncbi:MAG: alpha/beta hydrolase [Actinomycetota bacterium]
MTVPDTDAIHRQWFEPDGSTNPAGDAPLILLHEGLGSISAWGFFPQLLANASGRRLLAYDRLGYGRSGPRPPGPWPAAFLNAEATALPALLRAEGIERCVLVGHSDGGSIALLYPSHTPPDAPAVLGIAAISSHVFVEDLTVDVIAELHVAYRSDLGRSLARHHDDPDAVFGGWTDVWGSERFRPWVIADELAAVTCPTLVVQGEADAYGTWEQVERTVAGLAGPSEVVGLPGVDHWPHREATAEVLDRVSSFADRVDPGVA